MKQPKPDRLVEIDGIPMTVHSADDKHEEYCGRIIRIIVVHNSYLACSPKVHSKRGRRQGGNLVQSPHNPLEVEERWMKETPDGK